MHSLLVQMLIYYHSPRSLLLLFALPLIISFTFSDLNSAARLMPLTFGTCDLGFFFSVFTE